MEWSLTSGLITCEFDECAARSESRQIYAILSWRNRREAELRLPVNTRPCNDIQIEWSYEIQL